jgi:uncharacterized membrane protein YdjX (TVP38/TMEM64 family)
MSLEPDSPSTDESRPLNRYWTSAGLVLLLFLSVFLLVEHISPSFVADPYEVMGTRSQGAALIGVGLLVADIVLPVPSSVIMIANGALFGVVVGAGLSVIGNLGAAMAGFYIGRKGETLLARLVPPEERSRADKLLSEWGLLALIVTRPVPLLAETTVIMAGASTMPWRRMLLATLAGASPVAVVYAVTGATAADLDSSLLAFGLVLIVAGLFWIARLRLGRSRPGSKVGSDA